MKVYISGPISGLPIEMVERVFREAEMAILTRGQQIRIGQKKQQLKLEL